MIYPLGEHTPAEAAKVVAFGMDKAPDHSTFIEGYVPPIAKGTRVRATAASELIAAGSLGTVTWTHPWPDMPYRVEWDSYIPQEGEIVFGMSDIGWLTKPEEIEVA